MVSKRSLLRLLGWSSFAVLMLTSCTTTPPPEFADVHQGDTRIFVYHTPLWPKADEPFTIKARAEPGRNSQWSALKVSVFRGNTQNPIHRTCSAQPNSVFLECEIEVPAPHGGPVIRYSAASIEGAGGTRQVRTPTFKFDLRPDSSTADRLYVLRAPNRHRDGAFDIALVRSCGVATLPDPFPCENRYSEPVFLQDAETALYDQILADPALRWRSEQLAILYYAKTGQVADSGSALSARCGSDPWPSVNDDIRLPDVLRSVDVLALLHQSSHNETPIRDCAGQHVLDPDIATLSSPRRSPQTLHHELGHVLFGLGDEYYEDEASRRRPGGQGLAGCPCCDEDTVGNPDGECPADLPSCDEPQPATCFETGPACPSLEGSCGNLFPSRQACGDFAAALRRQPWIESRAGRCRRLCGDEARPCPCTSAGELWVFDQRNPPPGDFDIMGGSETAQADAPLNRLGPACSVCAERSFCRRWHAEVLGEIESVVRLNCDGLPILQPPGG